MKSIRYILAISILAVAGIIRSDACGPYYPEDPAHLRFFRCCSPELEKQWQQGCRFQDYEKTENCLLWQKITSPSIPLKDIEKVVYDARLRDINRLSESNPSDNKFAKWLIDPNHKEDLDYILLAKEIEEIREYMTDPWYYPYDGDDEHARLNELMEICERHNGTRHADRYALQMIRLNFANRHYENCIGLWEAKIEKMPQNIVTDMAASYVGGAYNRKGNREKAIELFTRSQDIGSLINLKAWDCQEAKSDYKDFRIRELEYVFNRFPNSPLLAVKLQEHVRKRETFVYEYAEWSSRGSQDPAPYGTRWEGDSLVADDEHAFYDKLKKFAGRAISSKKCSQKAMWRYALAYLHYLDGNGSLSSTYLAQAESSKASPLIGESIRSLRMLMDASRADNSRIYQSRLLRDLKWLDERMAEDAKLNSVDDWQYDNKMNYSFFYWQDVVRKILLSEACPRIEKAGNTTLALQLANYASNRILQLSPQYRFYAFEPNESTGQEEFASHTMHFDNFRKASPNLNSFDYSNQFFDWIDAATAAAADEYAMRIGNPKSELDTFLNARSYIDQDYIYEIVGTHYLREMNYDKAEQWLSKVAKGYQNRTNLAKDGYFKLDPFRYQSDKKQYIKDKSDYKLRFAREMSSLEKLMASDTDPNIRANAKIRFAIGLRNSFGRCWYLTQYGFQMGYSAEEGNENWKWHRSDDREGFKDNPFAQKAYQKVDDLTARALAEFTDPEQAANAHLEMMNYKTLAATYPHTQAAARILTRCDSYRDYSLHRR